MKRQIEQRLQSLKAEFETGQKMLADLEAKQANLRNTLLRIAGGIQVLEEVLSESDRSDENNHHQLETEATELVSQL